MKKINIIYIYIILVAITFNACEDFLDVQPEDKVSSDQAFSRIEDFQYAVDGLYNLIRSGGYNESFVLYPDILSDNIIMNFDGRKSYQAQYAWEYNSNDEASQSLWSQGYFAIHSANMILDRIDEFTDGTLDERNMIKGEALAIRALVHFDLVRYYGNPIHSASTSDLGVPYMLTVSNEQPARNTVVECYQFIEDDLLAAEALLEQMTARGNNYFSAISVKALLARVYLTMKDFTNARDYASEVIASSYSLTDNTEFEAMWNEDQENSGQEIILKLRCTEKEGPRIGGLYGVTQSSEFIPTFEFYQMYSDNDVRKSAYFQVTEIPSTGNDYNFIVKYNAREGVEDGLNLSDIVLIRLAEIYLIRAEARAELGDDANSLADLNALRENRYSSYIAGTETGDDLKEAIQTERRLELAFEGHRWFDLKRLDIPVQRDDSYGHLFDGSGVTSTRTYLAVDAYQRLWPIPESERDGNPNCEQNTGY